MFFKRKKLYILFAWLALVGCANRGIGPEGGPRDSVPPIPLRSIPVNGAVDFHGKRIEVTFNEYLELNNVSQNLMMSPPQQHPPEIKARGKHLIIQFTDTLRDSTTYTLDFGDAVCDYTERNPLHGYAFAFSTGPTIDTLEAHGRVYDAATLNPVGGMLVGIHDDLSDTAFTKHPFLRIAKTDSAGYFRIGNMRDGQYRLYAVDDVGRDYRLTPGEALAFSEELITPQQPVRPFYEKQRADTLPADSLPIDTLLLDSIPLDSIPLDSIPLDSIPLDSIAQDSLLTDSLAATEPKDPRILHPLFLFKEQQQRLYLKRTLRDMQHWVTMLFSAPTDSLPIVRSLQDSVAFHVTSSTHGDTVTIWLLDSLSILRDSLYFEARYQRTDSLFHLEWYTDTLRAIWRAPKMSEKAREAEIRRNRERRLNFRTNARKDFDLFDTLTLVSTTPIASVALDSIHLYERIDTVRKPIPFTLAPHDSLPTQLIFHADLKEGKKYELCLDSGALHDIYGITHIAGTYSLQLKTAADYSILRVKLTHFDPKAQIQILNSNDQVLRELPAEPDGALFQFLPAATYYMRLYLDEDNNHQWTTGSWEQQRQPEKIYYFPKNIQTKSNWDFEEEWDHLAIPQTDSKPKELIKINAKK